MVMDKLPVDIDVGLPIDLAIVTKSQVMLMLKSTILERTSDQLIKISMPIYNGKLLPLEKDLRLIVVYTVKEVGRFEFEAQITNRSVDEGIHTLTLNALTDVKKSQRRNFFRVPFFESLTLLRLNKPLAEEIVNKYKAEHEKQLEKYKDRKDIIVDDPPPFFEEVKLECRDISGGGIRCFGRDALDIFEVIQGTLHLDGFSVDFKGEVIRVSASNDSVYPHEFGVKFTEMDENSRTRLIGYIFKKQRNLMKKG